MSSFSHSSGIWRFPTFIIPIAALVLTVIGCDDTRVVTPSSEEHTTQTPDSDEPLPPDIRLRIQYDQTEVTYSNVWPGSIVGNSEKRKTGGAQLMTEFEKTHEVRSYDDEGYLTASYEYLDGNHPGMNMPAHTYATHKGTMPYDPEDENPIVRSELTGNTITYFREDGSEAGSRPVEPAVFRVDPSDLDSLEEIQNDRSDVDSRRAEVLESLEERSISFRRLDEDRVAIEQAVDDVRGTSTVKKVIDLRFGRPIYLKYKLKNGNIDMVETRRYTKKSGLPVMIRSVTYDYDDRKGNWGVVARTEVTRRNVTVQLD